MIETLTNSLRWNELEKLLNEAADKFIRYPFPESRKPLGSEYYPRLAQNFFTSFLWNNIAAQRGSRHAFIIDLLPHIELDLEKVRLDLLDCLTQHYCGVTEKDYMNIPEKRSLHEYFHSETDLNKLFLYHRDGLYYK